MLPFAKLISPVVILACAVSHAPLGAAPAAKTRISAAVVDSPPITSKIAHYTTNRAPLLPSPLLKLPIGSITPKGWLRGQLELEAAGMTGRLPEISRWCVFESNAWSNPKGLGHSGWEELPYWLKGYGDLGYVLKSESIIQSARRWIDAMIASQDADGWFGPQGLKTSLEGKPDLWPHMVMLNVLQSWHEYSGDARILPFMLKYHRWLNAQPASYFGHGYWPRVRFGDNIETAYWLYNRTGEAWLLDLAKKIHENMQDWTSGVHNWHNVNIAQGFRAPAVYYMQGRDPKLLYAAERNYQQVMGEYGQLPGGGFGGDENCRPGYTDPRQGFETCGIVEFMHSFEMLTRISGQAVWSDRCEELAFNTLPASLSADWKSLHYLTCANQVQCDRNNKAPAIQNGGTMFSYSPFEVYRCCQHNVSHGWPYYAEELWLATLDGGLCASLYAPSTVTAKVGTGIEATISEETSYPFGDRITLRINPKSPAAFPLYLRVPGWCTRPVVTVNGKRVGVSARPQSYIALEQEWRAGDVVELQLPMTVKIRRWAKNQNALSVDYGPLTFSLKIGERWTQYGSRNEQWPEWEVFPTTPWNYGLIVNERAPAKSFEIVKKELPVSGNPFRPEAAPLELRARAKKIPGWTQDKLGMVGKLQASPVRSSEPEETVTLIPMGAARLRISAFPVIGEGEEAVEWTNPPPSAITASHCFESDSTDAVIDGRVPASSSDRRIPRFTWWDHKGTREWIEWQFPKRKVSSTEIYWFDDRPTGGCRVPQSWTLLYRTADGWKPVESTSEFGTAPDQFNTTTFRQVETTGLRIEAQFQPNASAGILEWRAKE